ncbi:hypothetical protein N7G274_004359 [Stereocaulon virgatum]|uniref:Uncharacterized protein n=1 Tax=Stereocaulon virgatum TaxID=373712 RepID=A0ABR4ABW0_9LECA
MNSQVHFIPQIYSRHLVLYPDHEISSVFGLPSSIGRKFCHCRFRDELGEELLTKRLFVFEIRRSIPGLLLFLAEATKTHFAWKSCSECVAGSRGHKYSR